MGAKYCVAAVLAMITTQFACGPGFKYSLDLYFGMDSTDGINDFCFKFLWNGVMTLAWVGTGEWG